MKPKYAIWMPVLLILFTGYQTQALTESCDALEAGKREAALSVLESQTPYECCEKPILQCLSQDPVCPIAVRLADDVCRRAAAGHSKATIELSLLRRAKSANGPRVEIDTGNITAAGDLNAPIEIVEYIDTRCPYCAISTRKLYESVTAGKLEGKAKLYVKPYIIRSHKGSTAGAMAMMAAQHMGKFWEMLLHMFENFDRFDTHKLPEWAAEKGMEADRFSQLTRDADIRHRLIESQKEAIRNGVERTPTLFINRREFQIEPVLEIIEDFVEGEYERLAKQTPG